MKRFWIFIGSVILGFSIQAQEVGLRFGDMDGNNIGIDATFDVAASSRIHGTISFGDYVGIDALYDFAVNPVFRDSGFYYYAGIGLTSLFASDFKLGVMGEVGFEYRFRTAPLSAGLDYRPAVIVLDKMDFIYGNFGFNFRYRF